MLSRENKTMKVLIICSCATELETFRGMLICELENRENRVSAIVSISNEKKKLQKNAD